MKTVLKITAGIVAAFVVLIVGATILLSAGAHAVDQQAQKTHDKTAITPRQLAHVKTGMTAKAVVAKLGRPADRQSSQDTYAGETTRTTYLYYNVRGADWSDVRSYQLTFTNGRLDGKNAY